VSTFLEKILAAKLSRIQERKRQVDIAALKREARSRRQASIEFALSKALSRRGRINIIAEIKRASPSKGIINAEINVAEQARGYQAGGAAAISVLTEEDFFRGSLDDLVRVREAVDIPLLRKDFIVDQFQIYEAAAAGADAILLIVAALTEEQLNMLRAVARDELRMDVLVEVHTPAELETAVRAGADLIGVNNRNLSTFEVSLDVSRDIIRKKPAGALLISESGISTAAEINELHQLGFDGFLIGETLMRSEQAGSLLSVLTNGGAAI
jgi:indole-3-glycerol phosphate synthase